MSDSSHIDSNIITTQVDSQGNQQISVINTNVTESSSVETTITQNAPADHGMLVGLGDDDHSQYHNDTRGDVRYYTKAQVDTLIDESDDTVQGELDDHLADTDNPHSVTKSQVGLGSAENTSDADKPVSTAQATAIAVVQTDINTHEALTNNPHSVTKSQVGLGNVPNTDATNVDNHTDGTTNKVYTATEKTKLSGIETAADVTDVGNVGSSIHGASAKTTPVDADTVPLVDSEASNVLKKLSWANIKATAKTYFDTLYQPLSAVLANTTASFTTADETKLDGIEASADVTDTANVTAAGALMDSEVTNLADVKAFDPADYADAVHTHVKTDLTDIADFLLESEVDADIKTLSLPASTTISTFGASLIDDAADSNARTTLGLGSLATLSAVDADSVTVSNLEVDNFKTSAIVTESETIASNDNDTTIPTSAAVKDAIDDAIIASGSGDVVGPGSSTDNAITRFDSTTGKLLQNSSATVDDNGSVNIPSGQTYKINGTALAKADITGLGTADSPQFTGVELGHASDTTLTRSASGTLAVEGKDVLTTDNTKTVTNKSISGSGNTLTNIPSTALVESFFRGQLQSNTTNSSPTGLTVQFGWGYIVPGSAVPTAGESVTFPTAFSSLPVVIIGAVGRNTSGGTDSIDDLSTAHRHYAQAYSVSTTGFSALVVHSDNSNLTSDDDYGYSWIAIGVV